MSVTYKLNFTSQEQIYNILLDCEKYFIPELSKKVEIKEYSEKIFNNAINFEACFNNKLVGLISMYINEKDSFGFITNVCVRNEFSNKGIASTLLNKSVEYAREKKLEKITLEVSHNNVLALMLYNKFQFKIHEENESSKFMRLNLN